MVLVVRRLTAFVADWVVLFAVVVAPQAVIGLMWEDWPMNDVSNGYVAWLWVVLTVSLPSWIYFTLCDSSAVGATLGKRVMGVRVRAIPDGRLSRSGALVRTAVKLLPWELTHVMIFLPEPFGDELTPFKTMMIVLVNVLLVVWLIVPFLNASHRALHDYAAKSCVVRSSA